jgi:hypothetical protein
MVRSGVCQTKAGLFSLCGPEALPLNNGKRHGIERKGKNP